MVGIGGDPNECTKIKGNGKCLFVSKFGSGSSQCFFCFLDFRFAGGDCPSDSLEFPLVEVLFRDASSLHSV